MPPKRFYDAGKASNQSTTFKEGHTPTVLRAWRKTIVADLRKAGRNVDAILGEAGLELRAVNREGARIPFPALAMLMEIAARELGDGR
ncbi:MAG: AraC family transcriptional regulator [bacterium]|nr:AraC family transcriptional regulator [bacterium]